MNMGIEKHDFSVQIWTCYSVLAKEFYFDIDQA